MFRASLAVPVRDPAALARRHLAAARGVPMSTQGAPDLESGENIIHVANQSTGHLIPLCIALSIPAALLAFVGAVIPWIWFFFVYFSHRGQCIVTDRRVFVSGCPGSDDRWWALWYVTSVDTGGWPFNTIHIHTQDGGKVSINHFGDHQRLAQVIRNAKASAEVEPPEAPSPPRRRSRRRRLQSQ